MHKNRLLMLAEYAPPESAYLALERVMEGCKKTIYLIQGKYPVYVGQN
jgi:hypothetical protein